MLRIPLHEEWQLTHEDLSSGPSEAYRVLGKETGWLPVAKLPCDIHMPLIEQDQIKDPVLADYCFAAEWTETKSWWFMKRFSLGPDTLSRERITLHLEALDSEADVWMNGVHLGHHRSAFYPFRANVKEKLREGENVLLVRVTSGLEHVSAQDMVMTAGTLAEIENATIGKRGDDRRANVRKPQFVYGWDWGPRVATTGIVGGAWLEADSTIAIRNVSAVTLEASAGGGAALLRVEVEAEQLHAFKTREAKLSLRLLQPDGSGAAAAEANEQLCLRSGLNYLAYEIEVPDARLWWPNGMGSQPLYTVQASLACGDELAVYSDVQIGIRTVRINTDLVLFGDDEAERQFTLEVNGVPVFCKGGNWIPADSIIARVSDEKYETLISEARGAGFNMLRIWGGGHYERDIFYERCDAYGILVWQDFMFSCGKYPDHLDWYKQEVTLEIDYQTRRLRNHASLALWCGNNENHWGFDEWWNGTRHPDFYGGSVIYNEIAPALIRSNCPHIPYWNSSPYGGEHPNGNAMGDRHHWHDGTMNADMQRRITPEIYDEVQAKFISEYGYIGPCRLSTIETYFDGAAIDTGSRIWGLHTNTFEKDTVSAGIRKHYSDRDDLSLDDYLLYAGLCQSLMYQYSLESIRSKPFCSGALFWMYNDCWGEVGWTIVDYYLRRKLSYYGVRRAFAPVKLILREQAGMVEVTAINETDAPIAETLECGFLSFDGHERRTERIDLVIPARSRGVLHRFAKESRSGGVFAAIPCGTGGTPILQPAILRPGDTRTLGLPDAKISILSVAADGEDLLVTLTSQTFAHAVHFSLPDDLRLSDHYFDLLPGETRTITIYGGATLELAGLTVRAIN
ncbi:beta-mannosidase [Paenibacillus montanisoli]|uniref:beta-mannosidase n=1 Tax=Paenibacillus montanisoli TaxID=2081970 RepID=A0A328TST6_9BACL|nr:glycoside hydrolase family 2 protein [Paenibacillus montanisoli]RAP73588.1 beta-mannosidase [Paenibacillus montanisoli]